ncbi:Putative membrane protein [Amycolatopsis japonica]|uniref:Putative membrane protein n=1 Tax=Amycolatopsis japonica TaxID=208439 RepID=A0A075UMF0_9PSEU|nr:hypothetical protein [Amycolatopsis japonica]AIG75297.1 Putative membrane protein [Amycolatopsis japonica]
MADSVFARIFGADASTDDGVARLIRLIRCLALIGLCLVAVLTAACVVLFGQVPKSASPLRIVAGIAPWIGMAVVGVRAVRRRRAASDRGSLDRSPS